MSSTTIDKDVISVMVAEEFRKQTDAIIFEEKDKVEESEDEEMDDEEADTEDGDDGDDDDSDDEDEESDPSQANESLNLGSISVVGLKNDKSTKIPDLDSFKALVRFAKTAKYDAYEVTTETGDKTMYSVVNGKIVKV